MIAETVRHSEPMEYGLPGYGWTLKKLRRWVELVFEQSVSRNLLRQILQDEHLSWKQCQKVLRKANPAKRQAYIQEFKARFDQLCQEKIRLVYIDEAHFHRDLELGYTWAAVGQPAWRFSDCPRLADRLNWYGAYDFGRGQCFIWQDGACNGDNTIEFLRHLQTWLGPSALPTVIIWDGAPWHRDKRVRAAAADFGFTILPLPGYSPDLNPIEGLWKWMRQEVTQLHCYPSLDALFKACHAFIDRINLEPELLSKRLWPKFDLDPDFEKLLVSI